MFDVLGPNFFALASGVYLVRQSDGGKYVVSAVLAVAAFVYITVLFSYTYNSNTTRSLFYSVISLLNILLSQMFLFSYFGNDDVILVGILTVVVPLCFARRGNFGLGVGLCLMYSLLAISLTTQTEDYVLQKHKPDKPDRALAVSCFVISLLSYMVVDNTCLNRYHYQTVVVAKFAVMIVLAIFASMEKQLTLSSIASPFEWADDISHLLLWFVAVTCTLLCYSISLQILYLRENLIYHKETSPDIVEILLLDFVCICVLAVIIGQGPVSVLVVQSSMILMRILLAVSW